MTTYSSQPDDSTGYDAYIENATPTTNYNNAALFIGERSSYTEATRTLIKFDLSSIPNYALIVSAVLSLWATSDRSGNARTFRAYRLKRNWVETQVTWNQWQSGSNWGAAGATDASDIDTTEVATCSYLASESTPVEKQYSFGVAEFTKLIDGTYTNYGWLIKADTENDDQYGHESSASGTAGQRPKLVVEYIEPGYVTKVSPIVGLFEKMKRRTKFYQELLAKGAIPLGNRELMPI